MKWSAYHPATWVSSGGGSCYSIVLPPGADRYIVRREGKVIGRPAKLDDAKAIAEADASAASLKARAA